MQDTGRMNRSGLGWVWNRLLTKASGLFQDPSRQVDSSSEASGAVDHLHRALVERANDGIAVVQDRVVRFANPALSLITGYSAGEMASMQFSEMLHPTEQEKLLDRYERRMAGEAVPAVYEALLRHKDGHDVWVEINAGVVTFRNRPADLALVRDITERKKLEHSVEDMARKTQQLHQIARGLAECVSENDVYRATAEAAEMALAFASCTVDAVEGDRFVVKATSSQVPPGASKATPLAEGGIATQTHRIGKTFLFGSLDEAPGAIPVDPGYRSGISVAIGDVGVLQVVSAESDAFTREDARLLEILCSHAAGAIKSIRLQGELEHQALRDSLTDTYNRRFLTRMLAQELARSERYEHPLSVLMIDVNRFKEINDRFGHQVGDLILQGVASVLKQAVRSADIVARYGGDEFLVVQPETNGDSAKSIARIRQAVAEWNAKSELVDFPISLAIGAGCWSPADDRPFEAVLREADERMYEDKERQT